MVCLDVLWEAFSECPLPITLGSLPLLPTASFITLIEAFITYFVIACLLVHFLCWTVSFLKNNLCSFFFQVPSWHNADSQLLFVQCMHIRQSILFFSTAPIFENCFPNLPSTCLPVSSTRFRIYLCSYILLTCSKYSLTYLT